MGVSVQDSERQLRDLMGRGFEHGFEPQGPPSDRPLRHSSVLILFGALDRIPAAGLTLAVPTVPPELDVLLTRRADHMRSHPGQIAFPGGGAEPQDDGDPVRTALREAQEETGLDPAGVEVLGTLPPAHVPVSNNLVTPVVGWWRLPSKVAADHAESVEVFRAPVAELLDPAARGTSVVRHGRNTYKGTAFKLSAAQHERILWGFTGIMLARLFTELGWDLPWDQDRTFDVQV